MGLKSFLRGFWEGGSDQGRIRYDLLSTGLTELQSAIGTLATEAAELRTKVDELERLQLGRELDWKETRDKLLRYLKRIQEVDRREHPDEEEAPAPRTAQLAAVLGMKFPNGLPRKE